jgi:hypothetical protein
MRRYQHAIKTLDENHRVIITPDDSWTWEGLEGDVYNAAVNPEIAPEQLELERRAFRKRVESEGVWGIIGQYRCPCCQTWIDADSVWGCTCYASDWSDCEYVESVLDSAKAERSQCVIRIRAIGGGDNA